MVVGADDASAKAQAHSPATLFGGVAGKEDAAPVATGDALAGIGYVDGAAGERYGDLSGSVHGVYGVAEEVLDHPGEQSRVGEDILLRRKRHLP